MTSPSILGLPRGMGSDSRTVLWSAIKLYINLKSAETLGITFPLWILDRADDAIE
jgi:ABC-type uncharacterized transport system substrate-binding protein